MKAAARLLMRIDLLKLSGSANRWSIHKINSQPSTSLVTNLILNEVANLKQTKMHKQIDENLRKILS